MSEDADTAVEIEAQNDEPAPSDAVTPESVEDAPESQPGADNDVFPRSYVEELRGEAAKHRERAKNAEERAEALAKRLHLALVRAAGKLENAADLPFDPEHLADDEKLSAALDALLADKPYLKARKPVGDIGQGDRGGQPEPVSLLGLLRGRA